MDTLANSSTAQILDLAVGSVTDTLDTSKDVDWVKVAVESGKVYQFNLQANAAGASPLLLSKAQLSLVNSAGKVLATANGQKTIGWQSNISGDVFLKVSGSAAGDYRLSGAQVNDDFGTTADSAGVLWAGASATVGHIQWAADHDLFALKDALVPASGSATPDQEWQVTVTPDVSGLSAAATAVKALGATGAKGLPIFKKVGNTWVATFDRPVAALSGTSDGNLLLDIGAKNAVGDYTVQFRSDDYTANKATKGLFASVPGDGTKLAASGTFAWEGDKDWVKLALPAVKNHLGSNAGAVSYVLSAKDGNGIPLDPAKVQISLLDANGKTIMAKVSDSSELKVLPEGAYYLALADNAANVGSAGYTLGVSYTITDDIGATKTTASALTLANDGGGQATGKIETTTDKDWIRLDNLKADSGYEITVSKTGTSLNNFTVDLLNSNGAKLAGMTNRTSDGESMLTLGTGASSGSVFVAITTQKGAGAASADTGNYKVTVTQKADDAAANTGTAATLAPDDAFSGALDWGGDVDWIKISDPTYGAVAGAAQEWRLSATGYNYKNWQMKLYDADGKALKQTISFKASPDDSSLFVASVDLVPQQAARYAAISASGQVMENYDLELLTDDYLANKDTKLAFTGNQSSGWKAEGVWSWAKDKDWAKLDLTAMDASIHKFQVADGLNQFAGTKLALFNANGGAVSAATLNSSSHTFSLKGGAVYYLQIENTDVDLVGEYALGITLAGSTLQVV